LTGLEIGPKKTPQPLKADLQMPSDIFNHYVRYHSPFF